jgi:hypothetical protein
MVAGKGIHPTVILVGPLAQNIFGDGAGLVHVAKEMDNIFRPGQQGNVPQDDDAVETVVYKSQQAAKQLCEGFHRPSPETCSQLDHRTGGRLEIQRWVTPPARGIETLPTALLQGTER